MRITGSPGSYGPVRLGHPYVGCPYEIEPLAILWSHAYGWSTVFLRGFYGFTTMFWRRGRNNPYGYRTVHVRARTVHVRAPYGPVRA